MNKHAKALYLSTTGDNTIEFPLPLEVEGFGCGVIELSGRVESPKEDIFLCCDICEESFSRESMIPILRNIKRKANGLITNEINHMIWLRVMRPHISSIRLYIANKSGDIITLPKNYLKCTLVFIPPR